MKGPFKNNLYKCPTRKRESAEFKPQGLALATAGSLFLRRLEIPNFSMG
jgi:hypothetical protein